MSRRNNVVELFPEHSKSPLFTAIRRGDLASVREALRSGADPNERLVMYDLKGCATLFFRPSGKAESYFRTPLMLAAAIGTMPIAELLIEIGADVKATSKDGWSALAFAWEIDSPVMAALLLRNGASTTATGPFGDTLLILAAGRGDEEIVQLLLSYDAEIDARNDDGGTALMYAAANGHARIVGLLFDAGADAELKDHEGHDARHWANESGDRATRRLFGDGP
jgi:ankyrin repeat protein